MYLYILKRIKYAFSYIKHIQFSSVAQLCPTHCDLVDWSTPGFLVHHQLPELAQTHVHQVSDAISSSGVPFSSHLQSFPASGSFPLSQFFASSGQSIGVSPSASVFLMNIQGSFPLRLTGWISMPSKRLKSVLQHHSSKASILWHSSFCIVQLSHPYLTTGKKHSLD